LPVPIGSNFWSSLRLPMNVWTASGSRANLPINTGYSHGISGASVALRYFSRSTDPVDEIYIFLDDVGGTLANISMACAIYAEHATSASQPSLTLLDMGTLTMPSAVDKWIRVVFDTPYTPTVGQILWFVFWNASAAPTVDYPMILSGTGLAAVSSVAYYSHGWSTVNGWSAAGTGQIELIHVVKQGSNVFGLPHTFTSSTFFATSTAMKGIQFTPPCDIEVCGWMGPAISATSGIRIYDAATPPGGSPLYTFSTGVTAGQTRDEIAGCKMWAPITLFGGVTYNIVCTYGATAAAFGAYIEDYASFPAIFDATRDNFTICASVRDNAGSWLVDGSGQIIMQLVISSFPMAGSRASYALGI